MSGADWLAVTLLAGAVIVDVAIDRLRAGRRRNVTDDHDAEAHRRLMHEIRRLP